ncbi:hypothetical protein M758_9G006500, partial [Ceratodon purpureus]
LRENQNALYSLSSTKSTSEEIITNLALEHINAKMHHQNLEPPLPDFIHSDQATLVLNAPRCTKPETSLLNPETTTVAETLNTRPLREAPPLGKSQNRRKEGAGAETLKQNLQGKETLEEDERRREHGKERKGLVWRIAYHDARMRQCSEV